MSQLSISPFAAYLGTNRYSLSQLDKELLQGLIAEKEAKSADIALRVQRAKAVYAELERAQTVHLAFIEGHKQLLSPICHIPEDILLDIFFQCLEVAASNAPGLQAIRADGPCKHPSVVLSHVCSYWRNLVLDNPLLWRSMNISIPPFYENYFRRSTPEYRAWCQRVNNLIDRIKTWTQRSSPHPIHLQLENWANGRDNPDPSNDILDKYRSVIDTIVQETLPRLQELTCTLIFYTVSMGVTRLFEEPSTQYPVLRRIAIHVVDNPCPRPDTRAGVDVLTPSPIFAAPALRSVELMGHWGNIQAAKQGSQLPIYSGLTSCKIRLGFAFANRIDITISVDRLTSLTLVGSPIRKGFGPALHLPSLESLHFYCHAYGSPTYDVEDEDSSGMVGFVSCIGPQLRSFSISPEALTPTAFFRCLAYLPNIKKLRLLWEGQDPEPCVTILSDPQSATVCPRLEELQMIRVVKSEMPGDKLLETTFADFLASRRNPVKSEKGAEDGRSMHTIQTIILEFVQKYDVESSLLQELESRYIDWHSLDLDLRYPPYPRISEAILQGWIRDSNNTESETEPSDDGW
ncbi:hypothetical protein BKA70DRAFT_1554812 [Coprinopsis sp. MPI-PUGE-AT-0042]|nr:hypothetical protein BKA70DRAFT_1554812 [Coprinopsis sp. MPI-PUGE-AT-0042]